MRRVAHPPCSTMACLLVLLLTVLPAFAQPARPAQDPAAKPAEKPLAIGDKVEVFWGNKWWPASILQRDGQRSFVKYDGWPDAHNEWITPDRIRRPGANAPNPIPGAPRRPGQPPRNPAPNDPRANPADIISLENVPRIDPDAPAPAPWNLAPDPLPPAVRPLTDQPILLKSSPPANGLPLIHAQMRDRIHAIVFASPASARALISYANGDNRRVERLDLSAGRSIDTITLPDHHDLLHISPDATRMLLRSNRITHGTRDHLEIWSLDKNPPALLHAFHPYGGHELFSRDADFAQLLSPTRLLTVNPDGLAVLWDLAQPRPTPIHQMKLRARALPTLSPGGKYLFILTERAAAILDPLTGKPLAQFPHTPPAGALDIHFSPDGKRFAIASNGDIRIHDLTTGALLSDVPLPSRVPSTPIAFMNEGYLLLGNEYLVDLKLRMPVWRYIAASSGGARTSFNNRHWFIADAPIGRPPRQQTAYYLASLQLPDASARKAIAAVDPATLNLIKPGAAVSIELTVDAPDEIRAASLASLTAQLKRDGLNVQEGQPLRLVATSEPGQPATRTYNFPGRGREEADVTPTLIKVSWIADGRPIWDRQTTISAPGIILLKKDQSLADHLADARNKAIANFFSTLAIPTTVPNIPEDRALGASSLTRQGPKPMELPKLKP